MKYLEVILQFLISMARIVFPRRKKTDDDRYPSADPLSDPPLPVLPVERRDGSDAGSPWSDPFPPVAEGREDPGGRQLALRETFPKTDWLGISGYTLMLAGAAACVLKAL